MRLGLRARLILGLAVMGTMLALGVPSAFAAFHGIGVAKECVSPTRVGDPYVCTVLVANIVDTAHDTLRLTALNDTVNSAGGAVPSGNILPTTGLIFNGAVTCTGGSGAGTVISPYIGATECLMPFGSTIRTQAFSHYTVQPADFNLPTTTALAANAAAGDTNIKLTQTQILPGQRLVIDPLGPNSEERTVTVAGTSGAGGTGVSFATPLAFAHAAGVRVDLFAHRLTDGATIDWNNTCVVDPDQDCSTDTQQNTAGASTFVLQSESNTSTDIHNAAHQVVTTVQAGSIVHDFVTVTGQPGQAKPSGNVIVDWFTNGTCNSEVPAASSGNLALTRTVRSTPRASRRARSQSGSYSFRARYLGDDVYFPSVGACEPLQVVDAHITITPNGVNRVGQTHTFTAQVKISTPDSDGFVNAPDGYRDQLHDRHRPGAFTSAEPVHDGRQHGLLHHRPQLGDHRRYDGQRAHDAFRRRHRRSRAIRTGRARTRALPSSVGSTRRSRSRRTRPTRSASSHTFTVTVAQGRG